MSIDGTGLGRGDCQVWRPGSLLRQSLRARFWARLLLGSGLFVLTGLVAIAEPAKDGKAAPAAGSPASEGDKADQTAKSSNEALRAYRAAVALQNRESFDLARDEWQAFLQAHGQDPQAGKARHNLGVCYLQLQQYAEAAETFAALLKAEPQFAQGDAARYYLGLAHYHQGRAGVDGAYARAIVAFDDLLQQAPQAKQAPLALFYRGESQYATKNIGPAIADYQAVLKRYPEHELKPNVLYVLGVAQQDQQDWKQARATFETFLKDYGKDANALEVSTRLGDTLLELGEMAAAKPLLERGAKADNFSLADHALAKLAGLEFAQKGYAQAAAHYEALLQRFPNSPYAGPARLAAGNAHYLAESFEAATKHFQAVIAAGGASAAEAAHWLSRIQTKQGNLAAATESINAGLKHASGSPFEVELLLDQADARYEQPESRAESIALYQAIADKFPKHKLAPQALYLASFAALQSEQLEPARRTAAAFAERFAKHELAADVGAVAAEAALRAKDYAAAADQFQALATQFPKRQERQDWQLRSAQCWLLTEKYDQVLQGLNAVKKWNSPEQQAEALLLRGSAELARNQLEPAIEALQSATELKAAPARMAEIWLTLSRARRLNKQDREALSAAQHVLTLPADAALLQRARQRVAELAYSLGDYQLAAREYGELLKTTGNEEQTGAWLLGAGQTAVALDDLKQADELFSKLLAQKPSPELLSKGLYARALARQRAKAFAPAIEDLKQYLESAAPGVERTDAEYLMSLCLTGLGKHAEAAKLLEQSLASAPEAYAQPGKLYYELAWAQKNAGDAAAAAKTFEALHGKFPQGGYAAEAAFHVAEQAYASADYALARRWYEQGLNGKPEPSVKERMLHKLAWTTYQLEAYEEAARWFGQQLQEFPNGDWVVDAQFMQGESLFEQQKYAEASPLFSAAIKSEKLRPAFLPLAALHAAQCLIQQQQWKPALEILAQHQEQLATSAYAAESGYEQAWCQQNLGQSDVAYKGFEKVAGMGEGEASARATFMLGELLFERKEHKEAVRQFFKVAYGFNQPRWQAESLFEAGRCFEVLKNLPQALKCYQDLVDGFPNSDKVNLAKERLAALGGGSTAGGEK